MQRLLLTDGACWHPLKTVPWQPWACSRHSVSYLALEGSSSYCRWVGMRRIGGKWAGWEGGDGIVMAALCTQHFAMMKVTHFILSAEYMVKKKKNRNFPVCCHVCPSGSSHRAGVALMTVLGRSPRWRRGWSHWEDFQSRSLRAAARPWWAWEI